MPPKKNKKAHKGAGGKSAPTDLHSKAAHENFHDVFRLHGENLRGGDSSPTSSLFEGRFGRMFRTLEPAEFSDDDLKALAGKMIADFDDSPPDKDPADDEENSGISAGYTYLGQFIDHDLTFDPASSLQTQNDPDALEDYRTPRFDLDSLYGRGPDDQPYLYEEDGLKLLLGEGLDSVPNNPKPRDLPRNNKGRALIGDPRNDENKIVSQLHAVMVRFHNRMVEFIKQRDKVTPEFAQVQRAVRWHYQWVVLNDFLPKIVGQQVVDKILPRIKKGTSVREQEPNLLYFEWQKQPFMPIEFSAAAYRFGHSMVRPIYRLNTKLNRKVIFPGDGEDKDNTHSLGGFRPIPKDFAIDWSLFFANVRKGKQPAKGKGRVQPSYKIDTSLVFPLGNLPGPMKDGIKSLAERNLRRGSRMDLPSGQSVARFMNIKPIDDKLLKVGKATKDDSKDNPLLTKVSPNFADNAPLWYYVLAEAQQAFKTNKTPIRLGPVGGRIVAEVFIGLLVGDKYSFLSQNPKWRPKEFTTDGTEHGEFGMAELIKQAMLARPND